MGIFKTRLAELKEHANRYKNENKLSNELIANYRDKQALDEEYETFKKSIFDLLEKSFYAGKSKITLKPSADSTKLFSLMVKDEDFTNLYTYQIVDKQLEIQPIVF